MTLPQLKEHTVNLNVSDGTTMSAFVARPDNPNRYPGMLVFQEAYGVNGHIRDVTRRLARCGLVAIAPELFHRTAPGFEGRYDDFESVRPLVAGLRVEELEADIAAASAWLVSDPLTDSNRLCSVGFCMGGRVSFLANTVLPLVGAVSFYGGGIAPTLLPRAGSLHGPMLFFWGGLDRHITKEHRRGVADALQENGKQFTWVEFSDADHGFFCDARPSYHRASAAQAWDLLLSFLRSTSVLPGA